MFGSQSGGRPGMTGCFTSHETLVFNYPVKKADVDHTEVM